MRTKESSDKRRMAGLRRAMALWGRTSIRIQGVGDRCRSTGSY